MLKWVIIIWKDNILTGNQFYKMDIFKFNSIKSIRLLMLKDWGWKSHFIYGKERKKLYNLLIEKIIKFIMRHLQMIWLLKSTGFTCPH